MRQKKHYIGLTDAEVLESRKKYGVNILTPPKKEPLWKQFLGKFTDPLIIILMIAGVLSIGISFYEYFGLNEGFTVFFEPIGIFVAILLATGLAFYFELKADKEFAILNQVNDDELVEVIRNGNATQISKKDVVVGDIVIINTGAEVPADGELLECVSLNVDESTLTGEPMCHKSVDEKDFDPEATYPTNHVLKGTKVMEGHGIFCVTAVGDKTENGKVFVAAQIDDSVKTPLNEQLDGLSDLITKLSYGFAALVVIGRLLIYFLGDNSIEWAHITAYVLQTLMIAVTLIVVAVPEGLPMAVTLSLAYSMRRMLKTNNLVRKMHACETMGATTVICTDKTGTLTQNQMSVEETQFYGLANQALGTDETSRLIKEGIALNSTASLDLSNPDKPVVLGNPTEGALLLWLRNNGIDYRNLKDDANVVEELPFSTERKYMATVVESTQLGGKKILYVKGAPEIIRSLCKQIDKNVNIADINKQLIDYQNRAMRTLGFAYQVLNDSDMSIADGKVVAENLTFMGIVAIADPVRKDVPAAVQKCMAAGINVKIVTGDTPGTAKEIGRQIGLWTKKDSDSAIITGAEFEKLSDDELDKKVLGLKIIARARPMDKKRLVESLQRNNQVVAVTGDGTNDAPALKAAHVGLSMGDGTSVAKEASDITIIDNSFSSICRAVMWGRSLYQNIQRFLLFQLTVNVAACFIVLVGAFMGTESPLTVTQMLWVNLIMDTFGAMALASLPPSQSVMKDKPRDRKAFILTKSMMKDILGVGGFFFLLLVMFLYIFQHTEITQMTDLLHCKLGEANGLSPYEQTLLFSIFVWTHLWYMFNTRSFETGKSFFQLKMSKEFFTIVAIIFIGQIVIVEVLYDFFNCTPMKLIDWVIIVVLSSLVLWARELWHLLTKRG
ncbi:MULTISPECIES: calcium-translocating P-type ATPase, PMCA-type [Bacteroidaceae]|uniref:calcium-translocating P-type ATPase, PMCA-type n=1 Tax=Bacteroidaceae TaxID=815 RepID=UPI001C37A4EF|nr:MULTISPECIES: calcium-translocating P-type ATPase, PMCA-type [Bacteroidaceae]MBV3486409.1 calcium-translocating P-type ATPase, PMCA-type [Bacteroides uniformis]MBV3507216.1 calcium-translocating P-type ATPase, PMCA-type [Bacteroides uniformis]MBV3538883.1 calcium-translocating P-type ATPase, PMCA-type [Bacteroides uniformis]MBV3550851.1 calcium-translocating P-type ATPase, PMCA-type [Bacteroides uniformis]MBV3554657.1 calcium-translocating P-type ATPase, PMCA-type [Bacteroides uniformis]